MFKEKRKNNKEFKNNNIHKSKRSRKEKMLFDQEEDEVLFQEDEILLQEEILSEKDINEVPHINEEESCINEEELRINEEEPHINEEEPHINEEEPHINEEELRINEELRRNEEEQNIQDENKADESVLSTLDENKKGSNVWNHFDKFKDEKGVIWAKCRYCSGGKYNMGKGSSTGNLNRHLKLHPNKIDPPTMKQVELMNNFLREDNQRLIFTNEIFREKLATWIAADDLPFTTVESPEFGYLINICNPSARIPTADTVKNDILKIFKNYQTKIQNLLQNVPGKISFALDAWTSPNILGFLGITCHYIDANWKLRDILLDFVYLEGSHSGENLANAFLKCLEEKKIFTKTLGITTDNAANNNTFLKEFEKTCIKNHIEFHHKRNHVRCIAHVMNLAVQEILKYIKAGEPQDEDIILDDILNNTNLFTNKIIPKLRKLIVKIRASPQRRERFFRQCNSQNIKELNLILDVKTRWNSTYLMLKRALELQVPLDNIAAIDRELNDFSILSDEWKIIEELCRVLKIFQDATEYMSQSKFITLSASIPVYNALLEHIENLLDEQNTSYCPILEVRSAIRMGYEKLKEYYARTDDSYIYPIATILDPRIKLKYYTQQKWEQEYIDASLKIIKETYNNNYKNTFQNTDSLVESVRNDFFCMFELDNNDKDEDELEEYLRKPAVAFKTDPLQWWKTHEATYPHLANMVRVYL
ncbi:unnamed protein product [Rhizophagus irregularis]|nr:unnamed protein product [Rhizophagus irregularis]